MEHQATEPLSNKAFRSKPRNSLSAHGEPMIWITGGALCLCLFMIIGLLGLVVWQGLTSFWPRPIVQITTLSGDHHLGIQSREESYRVEDSGLEPRGESRMRRMIRTGNYELTNTHFTWVDDDQIETIAWPEGGGGGASGMGALLRGCLLLPCIAGTAPSSRGAGSAECPQAAGGLCAIAPG